MRAMKDSGIEWIGQIPDNWRTQRLKYLVRTHSGGIWGSNPGEAERDAVCIRVADFDYANLKVGFRDNMTKRGYTEKAFETSHLQTGDILLEKSGGGETTPVGRSVIYEGDDSMTCANFIEYLRPSPYIVPQYLNYWLSTAYDHGLSKRNVKQTTGIQNLDIPAFLSETVALPSIEEQESITAYINKRCADIDALIAAKERSNELLREQRQSIIYEAVTKGLNPNAPMKDSGVEWIGEIPEDWHIERLKHYIAFNPKVEIPKIDDDDVVSFIPMDCLKQGHHSSVTAEYRKVKSGYVAFEEGDILMAKVTPCLENGNLAIASDLIDHIGFGSTEINVIRCHGIFREYLFNILQCATYIERAKADMYGVAGLKRLNPDFIPNMRYPIPPLEEQEKIAVYLQESCAAIDNIIASNNSTIQKLREYRQSIIYEAVTGKIEV